jgi:DNA-binding CsgD family transcriptional regulator
MSGLLLSSLDQRIVRSLIAAEAVPGEPLPDHTVFEQLHRLVPCDELGAVHADLHGRIDRALAVIPSGARGCTVVTSLPAQQRTEHDGPFYLGLMYWRDHPAQAEHCNNDLHAGDGLCFGFRNGSDAMVQYFFGRDTQRFRRRDLAVLAMLAPVLKRLARERPTPRLPAELTIAERRVLSHVSAGRSNAQIAETLCISVGPVRKHLEHAYRKLGVTSRVAAIARMRGSDEPGLDLQERVDRFA